MPTKEATKKKAELLHTGKIQITKGLINSLKLSESTAGPDAGSKSLILSFNNSKVRLTVGKNSKFFLIRNGEEFKILKNNKLFIDNVKIVPILLHASNQAFVNIENRCIYNCKFCISPHLKRKKRTKKEIIEKIIEASKNINFKAIAITAGVAISEKKTTIEIIEIIQEVKKFLGNVVIGVEPCTTSKNDIEKLKEAGASEIKLNIQSFDIEIFKKICRERDFDNIISALQYSTKVFGKNKVCSNIIIGLGESNENVLEGVEYLAKIGAVTTLRAIRINKINAKPLSKALEIEVKPVFPERLIFLAEKQKEILKKYNLSATTFKTMCHNCSACDIVPGIDL